MDLDGEETLVRVSPCCVPPLPCIFFSKSVTESTTGLKYRCSSSRYRRIIAYILPH